MSYDSPSYDDMFFEGRLSMCGQRSTQRCYARSHRFVCSLEAFVPYISKHTLTPHHVSSLYDSNERTRGN